MRHLRKEHGLAVLVLALLLVMTTPVLANEVKGSIAWIEPDDHTFILVDDNNNIWEMRFLITGEVVVDGEEQTFWDVPPGGRVTVMFSALDEELLATNLIAD